jgi:adenylosuccinate synthase
MSVDVILGMQWGDEGKGKIVDLLADRYDIVARFQGGPNAGHTILYDHKKFILHTIPSGISSPQTLNVIGNGVIIDPYIFSKEVNMLKQEDIDSTSNLLISKRAHLIVPSHRLLDAAIERYRGTGKIGSTLKGIGPAYTDKVARKGLRMGDMESGTFLQKLDELEKEHFLLISALGMDVSDFQIENNSYEYYKSQWLDSLTVFKDFKIADSEILLNQAISEGKKILAEGAQGTLLDIDFGSYPFVTSSNTTTGGVCTGLGIPPSSISKVYGIFKAYLTRVGSGPFPTELLDEDGDTLRKAGNEFGSTTGRPRRCGWIDIPALRYSILINGITDLIITKSDVLNCFDSLKICKSYNINGLIHQFPPYDSTVNQITPVLETVEGWNTDLSTVTDQSQLPSSFKQYIHILEHELGKSISVISTGPKRNQTIFINQL